MILRDYHVHTTYCDGKNTAREMVLSAIEKGVSELGFSGHGYTAHDESYCMKRDDVGKYVAEIKALKEEFRDRISIRLGVEQDYYGEETPWAEYKIGSVHYIKLGDEYVDTDDSAEVLIDAANRYFDGDIMCVCERYFELVGDIFEKTKCDIIGHFDLITKFNEKTPFIDTENPRYISAWKRAIDKLIPAGVPFEVNLGAIFRGYRTTPYPSEAQRQYIKEKGGKLLLTSDCHNKNDICRDFDKWEGTT